MSREISATLTNLCMLRDGDLVLVQERDSADWPGITFPGGHVESGESIRDSVIREVWEETGLTVEDPVLCGVKEWENPDGSRYIVFLFRADRFSGTLHDSEEGRVYWIRRDELERQRLSLDFLPLLSVFEDPELSEFYYRRREDRWDIEIY